MPGLSPWTSLWIRVHSGTSQSAVKCRQHVLLRMKTSRIFLSESFCCGVVMVTGGSALKNVFSLVRSLLMVWSRQSSAVWPFGSSSLALLFRVYRLEEEKSSKTLKFWFLVHISRTLSLGWPGSSLFIYFKDVNLLHLTSSFLTDVSSSFVLWDVGKF